MKAGILTVFQEHGVRFKVKPQMLFVDHKSKIKTQECSGSSHHGNQQQLQNPGKIEDLFLKSVLGIGLYTRS